MTTRIPIGTPTDITDLAMIMTGIMSTTKGESTVVEVLNTAEVDLNTMVVDLRTVAELGTLVGLADMAKEDNIVVSPLK